MTHLLTASGPFLVVLAALALVVLIVFAARWTELRRARIGYGDFLRGVMNVLERGNEREALALCEETPAPAARLAAVAIRNRAGTSAVLRDAVDAAGRTECARLERRISLLAAIGQIAPLLGLVGTFCGFVRAAHALGSGALVSRADLSAGIVPGLVCAAAGLSVSILAHVAYALLRARLDRLTIDLEAAAGEILAFFTNASEGART